MSLDSEMCWYCFLSNIRRYFLRLWIGSLSLSGKITIILKKERKPWDGESRKLNRILLIKGKKNFFVFILADSKVIISRFFCQFWQKLKLMFGMMQNHILNFYHFSLVVSASGRFAWAGKGKKPSQKFKILICSF